MLWFLAQPLHYRLCKFFCSNLLLANTFFVNVVGMDAVLNRAQPGIVNALGDVRLTDVHEHEYGAMEQTGRIGEILPGAARRGEWLQTWRTGRQYWPNPPSLRNRRFGRQHRRECRHTDSA